MKRRKQDEELDNSHFNGPDRKRTRSKRSASQVEEDDEIDKLDSAPPRRRSSQRGKEAEETEPDVTAPEAASEHDEDAANEEDGDEEEIAETSAESEEETAPAKVVTPKKGVSGHVSNSAKKAQTNGITPVKKLRGKKLFSTPAKANGTTDDTPKLERHVDRSARRKSTRNLIEQIGRAHV